jgi:hypothetical protein
VIVERTDALTRVARARRVCRRPARRAWATSIRRVWRGASATQPTAAVRSHPGPQLVDGAVRAARHPHPRIIDFCDVDSQKWLAYTHFKPFPAAWVYGLEGHKLQRAEARLAAAFDCSTCATRAEMETLADIAAPKHLDWFPNGVDADYSAGRRVVRSRHDLFRRSHGLLPEYAAMLAFCRETLPLVRRVRPRG